MCTLVRCKRPSHAALHAHLTFLAFVTGEEMSDVLLYLVRISHLCRIDLAAAAEAATEVEGNGSESVKKRKRAA
jgi:hypothetical protein